MGWGMDSFEARKSSPSKLSLPPGRSRTPLKLTGGPGVVI
jgi:hypothetical protein